MAKTHSWHFRWKVKWTVYSMDTWGRKWGVWTLKQFQEWWRRRSFLGWTSCPCVSQFFWVPPHLSGEVLASITCCGFGITKIWSLLAKSSRCWENYYRISLLCRMIWFKMCPISSQQKAPEMFVASAGSELLPSRVPDAGRHFPLLNQS